MILPLVIGVILITIGVMGALGKTPNPVSIFIALLIIAFAYSIMALVVWGWHQSAPGWIAIIVAILMIINLISSQPRDKLRPPERSKKEYLTIIADNIVDFFHDNGYLVLNCALFGVDHYVVKDDEWSLLKIAPLIDTEDVKTFTATLTRKGYTYGYIAAQTFTLSALDEINANPHLLPIQTKENLTSQKLTMPTSRKNTNKDIGKVE
ncbi:MAG: hypothetical protein GVY30_07035 [Chloroflexi bacterium]|jgi:hypothetical protein|nr:hypothetical protein [Chloroflexota bacterium]